MGADRCIARLRLASVVLTLLALAVPASALATDRYVANGGADGVSPCTDAGAPCLTIAHAVSVANTDDVIHIAAGSYPEA